jgi:transposase-like protein
VNGFVNTARPSAQLSTGSARLWVSGYFRPPCCKRASLQYAFRHEESGSQHDLDVVDTLHARPLRRRWNDDVKAQLVAESYAPGAVVSQVAHRHKISPQLLSAWRKAARRRLLKPVDGPAPMAKRPAGTTRAAAAPVSAPGVSRDFVSHFREIVVFRQARNLGKLHNTVH